MIPRNYIVTYVAVTCFTLAVLRIQDRTKAQLTSVTLFGLLAR